MWTGPTLMTGRVTRTRTWTGMRSRLGSDGGGDDGAGDGGDGDDGDDGDCGGADGASRRRRQAAVSVANRDAASRSSGPVTSGCVDLASRR